VYLVEVLWRKRMLWRVATAGIAPQVLVCRSCLIMMQQAQCDTVQAGASGGVPAQPAAAFKPVADSITPAEPPAENSGVDAANPTAVLDSNTEADGSTATADGAVQRAVAQANALPEERFDSAGSLGGVAVAASSANPMLALSSDSVGPVPKSLNEDADASEPLAQSALSDVDIAPVHGGDEVVPEAHGADTGSLRVATASDALTHKRVSLPPSDGVSASSEAAHQGPVAAQPTPSETPAAPSSSALHGVLETGADANDAVAADAVMRQLVGRDPDRALNDPSEIATLGSTSFRSLPEVVSIATAAHASSSLAQTMMHSELAAADAQQAEMPPAASLDNAADDVLSGVVAHNAGGAGQTVCVELSAPKDGLELVVLKLRASVPPRAALSSTASISMDAKQGSLESQSMSSEPGSLFMGQTLPAGASNPGVSTLSSLAEATELSTGASTSASSAVAADALDMSSREVAAAAISDRVGGRDHMPNAVFSTDTSQPTANVHAAAAASLSIECGKQRSSSLAAEVRFAPSNVTAINPHRLTDSLMQSGSGSAPGAEHANGSASLGHMINDQGGAALQSATAGAGSESLAADVAPVESGLQTGCQKTSVEPFFGSGSSEQPHLSYGLANVPGASDTLPDITALSARDAMKAGDGREQAETGSTAVEGDEWATLPGQPAAPNAVAGLGPGEQLHAEPEQQGGSWFPSGHPSGQVTQDSVAPALESATMVSDPLASAQTLSPRSTVADHLRRLTYSQSFPADSAYVHALAPRHDAQDFLGHDARGTQDVAAPGTEHTAAVSEPGSKEVSLQAAESGLAAAQQGSVDQQGSSALEDDVNALAAAITDGAEQHGSVPAALAARHEDRTVLDTASSEGQLQLDQALTSAPGSDAVTASVHKEQQGTAERGDVVKAEVRVHGTQGIVYTYTSARFSQLAVAPFSGYHVMDVVLFSCTSGGFILIPVPIPRLWGPNSEAHRQSTLLLEVMCFDSLAVV
jgi:hypothetical protein